MQVRYQDPRNESHCESCGAPDPQRVDGYSACCGELVCDGTHPSVWVTGTLVYDRATGDDVRTVTGRLNACCSAMADRKAALTGPGVVALCRAAR